MSVPERIRRIVLLMAAGAWIAALGGVASGLLSDDPPAHNPYASGTTTTVAAAPQIVIENLAFHSPSTLAAGDTVTVVNRDAFSHTWSSDTGLFDSGVIEAGTDFSFTFEAPGTYAFQCFIHPQMTVSVTVTG